MTMLSPLQDTRENGPNPGFMQKADVQHVRLRALQELDELKGQLLVAERERDEWRESSEKWKARYNWAMFFVGASIPLIGWLVLR